MVWRHVTSDGRLGGDTVRPGQTPQKPAGGNLSEMISSVYLLRTSVILIIPDCQQQPQSASQNQQSASVIVILARDEAG